MLRAVCRLFCLLPARLDLEWHRWALATVHPLHPDVPHIVRRINTLERICRA